MAIIIIVSIIVFVILITWCWHNLGKLEINKKIVYIIIGLILMFVITSIVFGISKNNIEYQNNEIKDAIANILTLIFTGLNGLIVMPYIAKQIDRKKEKEIDDKEFKKKIIIFSIIFLTFVPGVTIQGFPCESASNTVIGKPSYLDVKTIILHPFRYSSFFSSYNGPLL